MAAEKSHRDYTIAIISAAEFEMSAFFSMLDSEHDDLPIQEGDTNMYFLGELNGHNIVLTCLPGSQGKGAAATASINLNRTFPSIKYRFLVGIGGGCPTREYDIRLGDVVISMPEDCHGGVVQYDLRKETDDGARLKGFLVPPPSILRNAANKMQVRHRTRNNKINEYVSAMVQKHPNLQVYSRPSEKGYPDILYRSTYRHPNPGIPSCKNCDSTWAVPRDARIPGDPKIHYGLIASGDSLITSGTKRSRIARDLNLKILCFEMEAAGIAIESSCIVIRGISDYADSHKNDGWQKHAAANAAAAAKEMILCLGRGVGPSVGDDNRPGVAVRSDTSPPSSSTAYFRGSGIQQVGSGSIYAGRDIQMGGTPDPFRYF